jgi:hypothetical protein
MPEYVAVNSKGLALHVVTADSPFEAHQKILDDLATPANKALKYEWDSNWNIIYVRDVDGSRPLNPEELHSIRTHLDGPYNPTR